MKLDDLQYEQFLLTNTRKPFNENETQRLKKIFVGNSNYIKKNLAETEIYCFFSYIYLLTIEKFSDKWIIHPSQEYKNENIYYLLDNFNEVIGTIQNMLFDRKKNLLDFGKFSETSPKKEFSIEKFYEKLGVATQIIPAVDTVYRYVLPIVNEFLENDLLKDDLKISLPWAKLRNSWLDSGESFSKFPLEKIDLSLSLKRVKKLDFRGKYLVQGLAQNISTKEDSSDESFLHTPSSEIEPNILKDTKKTLTGRISLSISISNVFPKELFEKLYTEIRASISHELAHLNEFYQRSLTGEKPLTFSLAWAGSKNRNLSKDIWKPWYRFHYLVYLSEPYEINAMVQEASDFLKKMNLEQFKTTSFWEYSQKMKNFSVDSYYQDILDVISQVSPHLEESITQRMKNWFVQDYIELEGNKRGSKLHQGIVGARDLYSLMSLFEKRIQYAGKDLERKLLRLFSLKNELV